MNRSHEAVLAVLLITAAWAQPPEAARAESGKSTRLTSLQQHVRRGDRRYPYREKVDYILEGAILVPLSQLKAEAENKVVAQKLAKILPKDKIIYCHCRSGGRVLSASPILKKLGYDARPLSAGYDDLLRAGFVKDENGAAE